MSQCAFGQFKISTEVIFKRYLVSQDRSIAKSIIDSKDSLYSLYCQADLAEDLTEKIKYFSMFIQRNPNYGLAKAYLNRGIAYTQAEKKDSSIMDFSKAIDLDETEPYAYYFRGEAYASLNNHDKAIEDYSKTIKMQPNFALAYHLQGMSLLVKNDYNSALSEFSKAIELDKNLAIAFIMRGSVYEKMGEYEKAIADWEDVKKLNKDYTEMVDKLIEKANKKIKDKK